MSFMGLLNFSHNEEGLVRFVERVLPRITERLPEAGIRVYGSSPTQRLRSLAEASGGRVRLEGFAEDAAIALRQTKVFVAPVYVGTGIKTKIIDAMALAMPIVTTPVGAEGLAVGHGEHLFVAESDEDFATLCVALMQDPDRRRTLGDNARLYAKRYHADEVVRRKLFEILGIQNSDESVREDGKSSFQKLTT